MDDLVVGQDPELIRVLEEQAVAAAEIPLASSVQLYTPPAGDAPKFTDKHRQWREANERRLRVVASVRAGATIKEACDDAGVQVATYQSWRHRIPTFAAQLDAAREAHAAQHDMEWNGTRPSFHRQYFGHSPTWFQILCINEMLTMPRGNMLMVLWPPEFGKTTTFEDHASAQLSLEPGWRFLVASESRGISQKILGRVMDRMSPMGPLPHFVQRFGPFEPQLAQGRQRQPWSDVRFRVHKAKHADERDYSMLAVGAASKNIVSTRTDHAHVDDIQSVTTLNQTDKFTTWFRQDVLSRAGEEGITTIFGTRVGELDFYEGLLEDPDLDASIMKVIRLPALITDNATNEVRSLWPEKWPVDKLDRQRKKVGKEAWDRNYMQEPGRSTKGRGTFNHDHVEPCKMASLSLQQRAFPGAVLYAGLDPSIGGKNAVLVTEPTPDGKLVIRRIQEQIDLKNNAQVINEVELALAFACADGASCTDLVVEAMAFQKGLLHDEHLLQLKARRRLNVRDHLTGWNKYDPDIGIPSMVADFISKDIVLPWADDDYTREMTGALVRQLYNWKPMMKGNRLRQDLVMALWFCWIIWRERYKKPPEHQDHRTGFRRAGLPYRPTATGLLVPA